MFRTTLRTTHSPREQASAAFAIVSAIALIALLGCGIETSPNPSKGDSGVNSGSGAGGDSGVSGKGGSSGSTAGKGGRGGSGGGTSGAGTSGTGSGGTSGAGSGGTDAGAGGSAGASGCTSHDACTDPTPQCATDGECVACTSDAACEARTGTTRCQRDGGTKQGQCVQCLANIDCTAPTPHCVGYACSECTTNTDCQDPARPQCTDGTCTTCTDDNACTDRPEGPHCITAAADPAAGTCAPCTTHAHCENPTPECATDHTCKACTGNDACTDRAGKTVCDVSTDQAFAGQCVECTGTQYAGCGTDATSGKAFVCSSLTRQCSEERLHNNGLCQACGSDAACALGQRCVRQTFKGDEFGYVCLWAYGSNEGGAPVTCGTARPYVNQRDDVPSIDGELVGVCGLRATTCEGLAAFSSTPCAADDACGLVNEDDGLCRQLVAGTNLCTKPCTSSLDCLPDYACNTGVGPRVCDLQPNRCYGPPDCPPDKPVCDTNSNTCKTS